MFATFLWVTIFYLLINQQKVLAEDSRISLTDDYNFGEFLPWPNQTITYSILKNSKSLSLNDTRTAFRYAFDQWSAVIPRNFTEIYQNLSADIRISFVTSENDKQFYNSSLIAYTLLNGEIVFNDDKQWKKYSPGDKIDRFKIDIIWVAMHNIGHILGLEHSRKLLSIMLPFYYRPADIETGYKYPTLRGYDIENIQEIYGPR